MKEELYEIARAAGEIILRRGDFSLSSKEGHANFVTTIDESVERMLNQSLTALLPEAAFIGEETENDDLTDDLTWIIDPVDGTTNLIHDYKTSAVSIALMKDKMPIIGLIYQPYTNEMFYAEKDGGAFLNDKPISVAKHVMTQSLVSFGTSPYNSDLAEKSMKLALCYLKTCVDIRRSGSAAYDLAMLACGRTDVFFELKLFPWDYAAGSLIVKEAGGRLVMPRTGGAWDFTRHQTIFAATPTCFDDTYTLFQKVLGGCNASC